MTLYAIQVLFQAVFTLAPWMHLDSHESKQSQAKIIDANLMSSLRSGVHLRQIRTDIFNSFLLKGIHISPSSEGGNYCGFIFVTTLLFQTKNVNIPVALHEDSTGKVTVVCCSDTIVDPVMHWQQSYWWQRIIPTCRYCTLQQAFTNLHFWTVVPHISWRIVG